MFVLSCLGRGGILTGAGCGPLGLLQKPKLIKEIKLGLGVEEEGGRGALSSRSCRGKRSARLLVGAGEGGGRRRDVEEKPDVESKGFQPLPKFLSQLWLRSHTGFSPEGAVKARAWASWDRLGRTVVWASSR